MKIVTLITLSLFYSLASLASSDWKTHWPKINGVKINNLCLSGENFQSIDPIRVCVAHKETHQACRMGEIEICRPYSTGERLYPGEYVNTEVTCTKHERQMVMFPRKRLVNKCVKYADINEASIGECLKWVQKEELAPLSYSVDVYREYSLEVGPVYSHSFTHTIEECL